jgi:hypothetical protein
MIVGCFGRRDMTKWRNIKKKTQSVATILERELDLMCKEWLRRVKVVPEVTRMPLTEEDRWDDLPKLFHGSGAGAFRHNGHCGRGGRATHRNRVQLGGNETSSARSLSDGSVITMEGDESGPCQTHHRARTDAGILAPKLC